MKSKYIECKRWDGDVQSGGGAGGRERTSPLARAEGAGRPLPSFPTPMHDTTTYIHTYVNTLLSVSVILLHFTRTSEPVNTHACFLCVLTFLPQSPQSVPPQHNASTHTGSPSRARPSGFPLGGFCSPSSTSRDA